MKDLLYDKVLAYQQTKLWNSLWDTNLFAVKYSDGKIGYCCVMGHSSLRMFRKSFFGSFIENEIDGKESNNAVRQ